MANDTHLSAPHRHAELDGLRGVAIALVMLFHAEVPLLTGGFFGVDVFFVLSGFLITKILLDEHGASGRIRLDRFYLKRVLRLLPAMLVMCLVFALLVPVLFGPAIATKYNREALVAVAFAMNWDRALALGPSYFLGHAWSLSIEAQFYLIWPLVLFFLQRGTKSLRPVLLAAAVLAFASGAWRVFLQDGGATPMRLFNGLDTRADSLMTGCLLAVVVVFCEHSRAQLVRLRWCLKLMAPVALITLIGLANLGRWPQAWVYLYGFVLAQVATAILILHVQLDHDGRIGRLLRTSWLVWLGTVSYGLYLWHFPIYMTLFALRMDPTLVILLGSALSLLVATISYYGMERPILAYKTRWGLTTPVTP